jgi:hypothetical protein
MSESREIIAELKQELELKIKQREGILDRLSLVDIEIDKMDKLIEGIDADAIGATDIINQSITPVKTAYDERITSGCRTDLIWRQTDSFTQWVTSGSGDGASLSQVTFTVYEVKKNSDVYDYEPYQGLKYYQKPTNRDYGSNLITEFDGYLSLGSTVVGVNSATSVPSEIKIGDTISDNLDNPVAFTTGDLPEVVGFGSTTIVGVVTTLVGGISTGSYIFANFGAGSITGLTTGMILLEPEVSGMSTSYVGVLTTNGYTSIVGFGSTTQTIEYYDEVGIVSTSTLVVPSLILDKPATNYLEEGNFRVGILTTIPALFISTTSLASFASTTVYVIRNTPNIDEDFNYEKNPNSPVKIGIIDASTVGQGHSVFYDASGDPNKTESWKPEKARDEVKYKGDVIVKEVKEPKVGAGRAEYYIGTKQWPTITTCTSSGGEMPIITCTTTYAPLGTKVTIGGTATSVSIGYTGRAQGGPDPNGAACSQYDSAITNATNNMNSVISASQPTAEKLVSMTKRLRERRDERELYAWSLLQSAARTREEIDKLKKQIQEMENFDFSKYEKKK